MEFRLENEVICTDLEASEYVIVHSSGFGECHGYVQQLLPVGNRDGMVTVRLELEDRHPAMQDALGDNPELTAESIEFIDVASVKNLERPNGKPIKVWVRPLSSSERAERARRSGFTRLSLPELDLGLRNYR